MNLKNFFDSDFKIFSSLDNVRSIPTIVDGLKDSQRKAVYALLEHGQKEVKVSQFGANAALITQYHHGETSMCETVVGLAQNYPGSNNVNIFEPVGQFGTILSSVSASHRYIFTKPSENLRKYFKKEDDCILTYRYEDGDRIEPEEFYPVLPMWAVNGSMGIGTGHSTKILPRDPEKLSNLVEQMLNGKAIQDRTVKRLLKPHYDGWNGSIHETEEEGKYELHGVLKVENTTTVRVTELPVGYGVDKFKAILVDLMEKGKVKDFDNNSTENSFDFEIKVPREVGKLSEDQLKTLFKLVTRQTENITLWAPEGKLKRYENAYEALKVFVTYRKEKYETRRKTLISIAESELEFLNAKKLFIIQWNNLENPGKMKTVDIEKHMIEHGVDESYLSRLMQLRISSLTLELIKDLDKTIKDKKTYIKRLEKDTASGLFLSDLQTL